MPLLAKIRTLLHQLLQPEGTIIFANSAFINNKFVYHAIFNVASANLLAHNLAGVNIFFKNINLAIHKEYIAARLKMYARL